jgi:hypothetical protein
MIGAAAAFLIAGIVGILIFKDLWFRVGLGAALVVVCGGLLLVAWRVDKKERDARAGLEKV